MVYSSPDITKLKRKEHSLFYIRNSSFYLTNNNLPSTSRNIWYISKLNTITFCPLQSILRFRKCRHIERISSVLHNIRYIIRFSGKHHSYQVPITNDRLPTKKISIVDRRTSTWRNEWCTESVDWEEKKNRLRWCRFCEERRRCRRVEEESPNCIDQLGCD